MKSFGIRINDSNEGIINVKLFDILKTIPNGESYYWSILFLDAFGIIDEDKPNPGFSNQISAMENGYLISWDDLSRLAKSIEQIISILIIGCKDQKLLVRYVNDQTMYETCDFAIEMIDSAFWEVFSKNKDFILKLAAKFKETEFLETDFEP